MDKKRVIMAIIGIPIVGVILTCGNQIAVNIFTTIVAILAMREYFSAISKNAKPMKFLGYISCFAILFENLIFNMEYKDNVLALMLPIIITVCFLKIIISNMKTNFNDAIYTIFGIIYIVVSLIFMTLIRNLENGKILIWYFIIASWGTDIFAYLIGKRFGKHKFCKVSPNKSIEGAIAGIIGSIISAVIYTLIINNFGFNYSYFKITYVTALLSILSQLGDLIASCIKRYVDIKDFGNLIPGHGGVLDRIDSLMYIAPFAYVMMKML